MSTRDDVVDRRAAEWFSPAFTVDPYPTYAEARETPGLVRSVFGFWIATRAADVEFVLADRRFGKRNRETLTALRGSALLQEPVFQMTGRMIINLDQPDHARLRRLVNPAFVRPRMEALRPAVQRIVDGLIDRLYPRGRMDVIADFAYPIPVAVICDIVGIPDEARPVLRRLTDALVPSSEARVLTTRELREANDAAAEADAFFRRLCAGRRDGEETDLTGHLAACAHAGRLSGDELSANLMHLFMAGHETTVNFIGNAVLALHQHPDVLAGLRADPSGIERAVDELLRYDSSVQNIYRAALCDVRIGDVLVREGEVVLCMLGAANRDPAVFPDPDRLDINRPHVKPYSFGGGMHYCLGAGLVRVEAEVALATLIRRIPGLELRPEGRPDWKRNAQMRGLRSLPARWTVGSGQTV